MGAYQSSLPSPVPDLDEIMTETGFSQANVIRLYQRFQALDKDEKGYLSKDDLEGIGELAVNPIGDRIINAFFQDGRKTTDFRTFAHVLARFRPVEGTVGSESINSRLSKLKFAFQLYDQDRDGKISRAELLQVLRMMIGIQVTDEQLESITDRTIQEADKDGDNAISFEEFSKGSFPAGAHRSGALVVKSPGGRHMQQAPPPAPSSPQSEQEAASLWKS